MYCCIGLNILAESHGYDRSEHILSELRKEEEDEKGDKEEETAKKNRRRSEGGRRTSRTVLWTRPLC